MRKLAAIMFTDIAGYTALMSHDEEKALQLLQKNRELLKPIIEQFRGEWLKEMGDGTLSSFASAVDAVNCALVIQRTLEGDPDLGLRIGIHIGDVVFERGDVFGDGVNVASRIEPLAEPGCICVSEQVYDAIRNKPGIEATFLGEKKLKGVDRPVKVYEVTEIRAPLAMPARPLPRPLSRRWRVWAGAGAAIAVVVAVIVVLSLLRGPGPEAALGAKSIAVLPFANYSEDEGDWFSDGITEEIITHLSRIADLKVISRTSAMRYKGTDKSLRQIGEELGVAAILEGSVRRAGGKVRITSQLIDARSDAHLWAESYNREEDLAEIFAIQSDVARQIAAALKATLTPEEEAYLASAPQVNHEAYKLYLKGWHFRTLSSRESMPKAVEYLEQAVALDPAFARAWAALAHSYLLMQWWGDWSGDYALDRMKPALDKALELDPNLPDAHAGLGIYQELAQYDIAGAETSFRRALELDPDNVYARFEYGFFLLRSGRPDEALAELRRAQELDPLNPLPLNGIAIVYQDTRQYDKALEYFQAVLELAPGQESALSGVRSTEHAILMQQGRYVEVAAEAEKAYAEAAGEWGKAESLFLQLRVEWVLGNKQKVYSVRDSLRSAWGEQERPFSYARLNAIMGEKEKALGLLERAYEESTIGMAVLVYYPEFDFLRDDPRFKALMQKMGLTEVFDQYGQRISNLTPVTP